MGLKAKTVGGNSKQLNCCTNRSLGSAKRFNNSGKHTVAPNSTTERTNKSHSVQSSLGTRMQTHSTRRSCTTTTTTTTYRSTSSSALYAVSVNVRPQTLNVHSHHYTPTDHTQLFLGEVLKAWRAKARCNVLPAERTQELFQELSFHPNDKQISEMLQTAKLLARKGSSQPNGLTFGEFCVFAADLKRFRTSSLATPNLMKTLNEKESVGDGGKEMTKTSHELRTTKSLSNVDDCKSLDCPTTSPVEVFLGGSCNPTTWRADVAIPTLKTLGITFYNPQVSDWTPDLIELEHRAKEKARVLFFVMDSETRASAGAIEAAHIAGQNYKQLVLVLHPYKREQCILNERLSQQEFIDLTRNQLILRELVTRRGLPVLDNIPAGLQRTKEILYGVRDPPTNIASILVAVRGAFDRVNPIDDVITIQQCQRALLYLGYVQSLVDFENLKKIINAQRETLRSLQKFEEYNPYNLGRDAAAQQMPTPASSTSSSCSSSSMNSTDELVDFNLFCMAFAYLSVLQQEIHESGCISPIKGTNVPPPPVYLTNMQGEGAYTPSHYGGKNVSRTSSSTSILGGPEGQNQSLSDFLSRSGDSGTFSPLPIELKKKQLRVQFDKKNAPRRELSLKSVEANALPNTATIAPHLTSFKREALLNTTHISSAEEESDSNDSVFSSSNSSLNSINCCDPAQNYTTLDFREVYLGGSCYLRTRWRQDIAIPHLKAHNISYHLPALHESLMANNMNWTQQPDVVATNAFRRTTQKPQMDKGNTKSEGVEELNIAEEVLKWSPVIPVRTNLYNPALLDSSRVLLFVITRETRSLAPMTLAAHCIGLMYNVVLAVQMLPDDCVIGDEKLTPTAVKDYNRGRSYLIDLAKRQGVPVYTDVQAALDCVVDKVNSYQSRRYD